MAMDFHYTWRTDPKKVQDGAPVSLGDGASITVRRFGNKEYTETQKAFAEEWRRKHKKSEVPDQAMNEITNTCIAKHILVHWEGFEDRGVPVPYTEEHAYQFLSESEDFRNRVLREAMDLDNFVNEREATLTKNSSVPTPGS